MIVEEEGEGRVVLADGKAYVLSPLTLAQVKRVKPLLAVLAAGADDSDDAAAELVAMALRRHHPEIGVEQAADLIEFRALGDLIKRILDIAGLGSQGEAGAGQR